MSAAVLNARGGSVAPEAFRERECVHRAACARGRLYEGAAFVRSLSRPRACAAAQFAKRVTSFYWSDAAHVVVWLCDECAAELGMSREEA
ncbi:MAG: hypothetical protein ABR563_01380 [Pyrinomonadaceae bacterium]